MNVSVEQWRQRLGTDAVSAWGDIGGSEQPPLDAATPVVSPSDLDGIQEALRFATSERLRVLPGGSFEHLGWGAPLDRVDVVLSSRRMNRILEYEPGDLTLTAEAGVTLHSIEERVRKHQQRLAPDPWPGVAATLGGACAAHRFGLSRLRYGTMRDAVLGARVVHADGTTTRTGGKVVKNVTGYDLARIYIGSQGSLVFMAELNLRLVPRPHATALVHAMLPFDEARRRIWEVHRSVLQPVAVVITDRFDGGAHADADLDDEESGDRVHVLVRFEGRAPVVEQQANACKKQLGGRIVSASRVAWDELRQFVAASTATDLVQVSAAPTSIFDVIDSAREHLDPGVRYVGLFGVGTTWLQWRSANATNTTSWMQRLPLGWHVRRIGPTATLLLGDTPAPALQEALKTTFDPQGTLRALPTSASGVQT